MTLLLSLITLTSLFCVHGQQNDKGTSMIPFPRIGRADPRFFMDGKRTGNVSPGLIPFPRIGRSEGIHEGKRQLIPFPRVGKRPYWRVPVMDAYPTEYEDYTFPLVEVPAVSMPGASISDFGDEPEAEKRTAGAASPSNTNNNGGGMWFGPRLGRRKRSVEAETSRNTEAMDTRLILKILNNFNWAIVPLKERRNFTPRLGRSFSVEEQPMGALDRRSEPYTPRLGRAREVAPGDMDEDEDRAALSHHHRFYRAGKTQKPKGQSDDANIGGVPFSPRLGRDHINPRLGRSSTDEHERD